MKCVMGIALLFMATEPAAENPLGKLPFGIVLGTSTSKDIRARGVCWTPEKARCDAYKMLGGKFVVYLSESDVVNKVRFDTAGLPQPWKDLGLKVRAESTTSVGDAIPEGPIRHRRAATAVEGSRSQGAG